MNPNRFYVYALLDPRKPGEYEYGDTCFLYEPFYIGKGQFNRCNNHVRDAINKKHNSPKLNKIRKILKQSSSYPIVCKVSMELTNKQAINIEKEYIKEIGRIDLETGPLTNLTDGGEGLQNLTPELRKKKSQLMSGKNNPMYGIRLKGNKNPFYGRTHSITVKKQLSKIRKGSNLLEATKKKISLKNKGLKRTEETKIKMRKPKNVLHKKKISKYRKINQFGLQNPSIKWKYNAVSPSGKKYQDIYSISSFCKSFHLNEGSIRNILKNNKNKYKGWLFYREIIEK